MSDTNCNACEHLPKIIPSITNKIILIQISIETFIIIYNMILLYQLTMRRLFMSDELQVDDLRILAPKEIAKILGVSIGTFHKIRKDKSFPQRKHFGAETRGWLMRDVRDWALSRPEG